MKIHEWHDWVEICNIVGIDPYENSDCGLDIGGGDSMDWEYVGDIPEKNK